MSVIIFCVQYGISYLLNEVVAPFCSASSSFTCPVDLTLNLYACLMTIMISPVRFT